MDIDVQPMMCLVGQRLKHPVCLPTQCIDGETLVRWVRKEPWINQVVAGRVDCPKLDAATGRVRESIVKAVRSATKQDESDMVAAAQAGRMELGLDDDSDTDEPSKGCQPGGCQPAGGMRVKRRRPGVQPATPAVSSVEVVGVAVKVAIVKRVLWVECTPETVRAFADAIARELVPAALQVARDRAPPKKNLPEGCQPDADVLRGRIYFSAEKQTWVAVYENSSGRRCYTQRGLGAPMTDAHGNRLGPDEYAAVLKDKLLQAKRAWNVRDRSKRPRIVES